MRGDATHARGQAAFAREAWPEACRELAERMRAGNPDLLVVFMSGYTDEILDQQSLVGPGAEFLAKPFTPGALVRQVDRLLAAHRPSRAAR